MTRKERADLDREIRAHIELEAEEQAGRGLTADDARRVAHRLFGNKGAVTEAVHNASPWAWWERLRQDVRFGLRVFRHSPAFALTAVFSLALGIGANATMFNVINAVMLRPLRVNHPEALVQVSRPGERFSFPSFRALRQGNGTLTELFSASFSRLTSVGVDDEVEPLRTKVVSGNYFAGLGLPAASGRLLATRDETDTVAVISHAYWTRRFNASPAAIGRALSIDGVPFTIVGVAPASFTTESPGDVPAIWTPMSLVPQQVRDDRGYTWLYLLGRLKPGVTVEQARADLLAQWTHDLDSADPSGQTARTQTGAGLLVTPGAQGTSSLSARLEAPIGILSIIVLSVLLIVCANLAGLLLTRGAARRGEVSLRLALGATRGRIVRQLLTENVVLAIIGGAIGLLLAYWGALSLVRLASVGTGRPLVLDVRPDQRVLLVTTAISVLAGLLFGLAPAWRTVRELAAGGLHEAGNRIVTHERRWGLRNVLIVAQMTMSFVLLAGSVLFLRTLTNLQTQELGFQPDGVLAVQIVTPRGYKPALDTVVPELTARLRAIPGVASAAVAASGTLANSGGVYGLQFDGFTPSGDEDGRARADSTGPGYFRTAGIRLAEGRDFTAADGANAAKVAIVNQTAARFYFGTHSAIGRGFIFNKERYEIVGVARDAKYASLRENTPRFIYFALLQSGTLGSLELRTADGNTSSMANAVRAVIHDVDPRLNVAGLSTLSERIDGKLGPEHLIAGLTTFFGGLTLVLVSLGLYGTLAYAAARRRKELGLRLALGATRRSIVWLVLRDVVVLVGTGLALGVAGALALGQLVHSVLFGLEPSDAATLIFATAALTLVSLAASAFPAMSAGRLDPARVLRH